MRATRLPRLVAVLGAAAVWTLMSPGPAWSIVVPGDIVLTFTEFGEGATAGIRVTETGASKQLGGTATLTVSGETVTIFGGSGGFTQLGTGTRYVFNLYEFAGGPISDQVIVTPGCGPEECPDGIPVSVMFTSDPADFDLVTTPTFSAIENGTTQFVGSYLNECQFGCTPQTVKIFVLSDVDATVPAPATLLLLGAGLTGLAGTVWRRHRRG